MVKKNRRKKEKRGKLSKKELGELEERARLREFKRSRYLITAAVVTLIFVLGLLLGNFISKARIDYLENEVYQHRLTSQSLELQSLFLTTLSSNQTIDCENFNLILEKNLEEVGTAQKKVENYMKETDERVYYNYKIDYTQAQIRYWLMHQNIRKICQPNNVAILYFYSNVNCMNCKPQGTILTYLKNKFGGNLLIFSIDADLIEEPMVEIFKEVYEVDELPTIIVEEKTHKGFMSRNRLISEICKYIPEHKAC